MAVYDANDLHTQKRQYDETGDLQDYIWKDGKLSYQYLTLIVYITYKGITTALRSAQLRPRLFMMKAAHRRVSHFSEKQRKL